MFPSIIKRSISLTSSALWLSAALLQAEPWAALQPLFQRHCTDCHDAETKKGGLDLTRLSADLSAPADFTAYVKIHDRLAAGEMPPQDKPQPEVSAKKECLQVLAAALTQHEQALTRQQGRAQERRLNRYEYENALRDLFSAPWLQLRDRLPEDGEAFRYNRIGSALDVSHVQMARYLQTAEAVLHEVMAPCVTQPKSTTTRYYTRSEGSWTGHMKFTQFNQSPERATFPVLGYAPQPAVRAGKSPMTDPAHKDEEGVGVVASSYEPLQPQWGGFTAKVAGHYRLRINAHAVWVGAGEPKKWWRPNLDVVSQGHRAEPISVYAVTPPNLLRKLGNFDAETEPTTHELDVWLVEGEKIRPDAVRLFRSRPSNWQNPLATPEGQPGVCFRWLEVEGPLSDTWPPPGQRLLSGDLPLKVSSVPELPVEILSEHHLDDAARLLGNFISAAYRRPLAETDTGRFLPLVEHALDTGSSFTAALLAGYTAVLCSPEFLYWQEMPGKLTDLALADRLASFLINAPPDAPLRTLALAGKLHDPATLAAETDRLLNSPNNARFVNAFLDYWLELRKATATAPDSELYADYYLDDYVAESAQEEAQRFFTTLLAENLPSRYLVDSDFVVINERLAELYAIPSVLGSAFRKVSVPQGNPRGGLMTQAIVLKVTANGTTTSPVLRGAWVMERLLGETIPPPPASVPAVEPDTRGATTIRQQLAQHRSQESCSLCHAKIDPAGFALESFDVMGGWRDHYRALGDGEKVHGWGKSGLPFAFHIGPVVDPSGILPDGRPFTDIQGLKKLLLTDEPKVARNLAKQLLIYATGAPIRFSDRPALEAILTATQAQHYGVRSLVHAIVQSPLFLEK